MRCKSAANSRLSGVSRRKSRKQSPMSRALNLVILLVVASLSGWGISIPVITYNNIAGNQEWTGALSFAFQVNRPITIDALGVFDSGSDGLARNLYVEIREITNLGSTCSGAANCSFSITGTTLAADPITSANFSSGGSYTLLGGARWQAISPVALAAGYYMLTSVGYGAGEPNYNADGGTAVHVNSLSTFGGAITWGVGTQSGNAYGTGALPTIWDYWKGGVPIIRYGAGTFSVVPEPGAYALMGTVGLALYWLRRRRAASKP